MSEQGLVWGGALLALAWVVTFVWSCIKGGKK